MINAAIQSVYKQHFNLLNCRLFVIIADFISFLYLNPYIFTALQSYAITVHAYVASNGICRGFAFKYGKFLLPPRFLTALSVPKVPTRKQ